MTGPSLLWLVVPILRGCGDSGGVAPAPVTGHVVKLPRSPDSSPLESLRAPPSAMKGVERKALLSCINQQSNRTHSRVSAHSSSLKLSRVTLQDDCATAGYTTPYLHSKLVLLETVLQFVFTCRIVSK